MIPLKAYYFVLLLIGITSCQTVVNIDLPEADSKLVLNAEMRPDSVWRFYLSQSKGILEPGELESVRNGSITVLGSDGSSEQITQVQENNNEEGYPVYRGIGKPLVGVTYQVLASAPNLTSISAKDSVPLPTPIQSVDTASTIVDGSDYFQFRIRFDDPIGNDFYDLRLYYFVELPFDTNSGQFANTTYIGEIPYNFQVESFFNGSVTTVFDDVPFNGQAYVLQVIFDKTTLDAVAGEGFFDLFPVYVICELRSVSETYFNYSNSFDEFQASSFDPFSQPTQVYSNVQQGFGVLSAFSWSRDTIQVNRPSSN